MRLTGSSRCCSNTTFRGRARTALGLPEALGCPRNPVGITANRLGVSAKFLAEPNGHSILKVRTAGFDDCIELSGLPLQRLLETPQGAEQLVQSP